jgi:hypothetical protein
MEYDVRVAKEIKELEVSRRIELITKLIIEKAKKDVQIKYGNKKRHKQ